MKFEVSSMMSFRGQGGLSQGDTPRGEVLLEDELVNVEVREGEVKHVLFGG